MQLLSDLPSGFPDDAKEKQVATKRHQAQISATAPAKMTSNTTVNAERRMQNGASDHLESNSAVESNPDAVSISCHNGQDKPTHSRKVVPDDAATQAVELPPDVIVIDDETPAEAANPKTQERQEIVELAPAYSSPGKHLGARNPAKLPQAIPHSG